MTHEDALRTYELEESAQGSDLFRAPGSDLQREEARDQAEASGWIPEKEPEPDTWPGHLSRAKEHHLTVREAMGELERIVSGPAATVGWHRSVEEALFALSEALDDHIGETEADDGLLAEAARHAPRLSAETELLHAEHSVLRRSLNHARTTVRGSEAVRTVGPDVVRRRVMALLGRLMLHRQRAADVIYDAYNVDIAASD